MAIDVLKRQGKSAVTGLLGKNLRRVAGNIGSVMRGDIGSESSETAPLNRSKQSTKMLSFPIDVGADPGIGNNGHYVMFFINEQENARLLDLNNLQLDPKLTHISSIVLADSGSPFRQSVLINVGLQDGIQDGWAAMDGLGLVGRISGVGSKTARVLLLTDTASIIPATIQPSGQQALIAGDNTIAPTIEFLENADLVRPGDRIETSGSGGIFPPNLLIGRLELDPSGRLRVRLSADYERLEFLRVLRNFGTEPINDPGKLIIHKSLKLLHDNESAAASGS